MIKLEQYSSINTPVYGSTESLDACICAQVVKNCYENDGNFNSLSLYGTLAGDIEDLVATLKNRFTLEEHTRRISECIYADARVTKIHLSGESCYVFLTRLRGSSRASIDDEDDYMPNTGGESIENNNWEVSFGGARKTCESLMAIFRACITKINEESKGIYCVMDTQRGLRLNHVGYPAKKLIPTNYSKKVLEGYERIISDIASDKPQGALSIISGPAGTGKTYMTRAIIEATEREALFIMIPPSIVDNMSGPHMIPLLVDIKSEYLQNKQCVVFVIEDADSILVPRGADNMSAISNLLNCTDGILGALFSMRVVATTNADSVKIDDALVRPGRLSCKLEVGPLSKEEAIAAYDAITKTSNGAGLIDSAMTLAEIYALANGNDYICEEHETHLGF